MTKQPKKSPYSFSYDNFRVIDIKFSLNEKFNASESAEIKPEIGMNAEYDSKTKYLRLKIGIRQSNQKGPFTFEIIGEGLFKFDKKPDDESLRKISAINCPAIMFPYLRETVADITGRAGFAPLHLAPVNFVALAEKGSKTSKKLTQ